MPLIIPIFIMHQGCPHRCCFCNQQKAVGPYPKDISEAFFRETVFAYLRHSKKKAGHVQIAFYGGNFTGMAEEDQIRLLEYAKPFLEEGWVDAIRISTRPDCIDREQLDRLKKYGVQIVEIGVQSLVDHVLKQANRGHGVKDVADAVQLLKAYGMQIGIHLMAGLPGDSPEGFVHSVHHTIFLKPQMVRIHPTLVFTGTPLAQDYRHGNYEPLALNEAVLLCKLALKQFTAAGVPVIRIGLQTTPVMEREGTIIAGPYHPAFRSLVESALFFDRASALLSKGNFPGKTAVFSVSPRDDSNFRGWRNENLRNLQECFGLSGIRVASAPAQHPGTLDFCILE